jgi:hypothetical protein
MSGVEQYVTQMFGGSQGGGAPTQGLAAIGSTPTAMPTPDPYSAAAAGVQQRFPLLKNVPLNVTTGGGPYESEVYQPWDEENPAKGKFTVQMRSDAAKAERGQALQDSVAAETFHYLGTTKPDGTPVDPEWYGLKQQFIQTLTPRDLQLAKQHWQEENQTSKPEDRRSFKKFMDESYADMFVRGYIFPESQGKEWVDRKGKWPKQQSAVLDQMKQRLMQPQ